MYFACPRGRSAWLETVGTKLLIRVPGDAGRDHNDVLFRLQEPLVGQEVLEFAEEELLAFRDHVPLIRFRMSSIVSFTSANDAHR